jgi:hypothetical protein
MLYGLDSPRAGPSLGAIQNVGQPFWPSHTLEPRQLHWSGRCLGQGLGSKSFTLYKWEAGGKFGSNSGAALNLLLIV